MGRHVDLRPLEAFRAQYPAYDDLSDQELLDGIYRKSYSDMPRAEFDQRMGEAARPVPSLPDPGGDPDPSLPLASPPAPTIPGDMPQAPEGGALPVGGEEGLRRGLERRRQIEEMIRSRVGPDGEPLTSAGINTLEEEWFAVRDAMDAQTQRGGTFAEIATSQPDMPGVGPIPGTMAVTTDRARRAARGLTAIPAGILESLAILGAASESMAFRRAAEQVPALEREVTDLQTILTSGATPDGRTLSGEELQVIETNYQGALATLENQFRLMADLQDITPAEEREIFALGKRVRDAGAEYFGEPDPMRNRDFWGKVSEAGGNMAGFLAVTIATGGIAGGGAALAAGAATGAAVNAADIYKEALEAGLSEEDARNAAAWAGAVGTTEILPIMRLITPLTRRFPGIETRVGRVLAGVVEQMVEEGTQEGGQQIMNNLIAQGLYDPDRGWSDGVTEAALIGAITGATVAGGAGAVTEGAAILPSAQTFEPQGPSEVGGAALGGLVDAAAPQPFDPAVDGTAPAPISAQQGPPVAPLIDIEELIGAKPPREEPIPGPGGAIGATEMPGAFEIGGYMEAMIGAESSGDPTAENDRSSAGGLGQFLDATWLATVRGAAPDVADGKTDAEIIALKTDGTPEGIAFQRRMLDAFTRDNITALERAGVEVTDATVYAAHFFGAGDAIKVLRADPSTPVSDLVRPGVIDANPHLAGMSAGQAIAWAGQAIGRNAGMTRPSDRFQPDMLGGEALSEDDLAVREEITDRLREADLAGFSEFDLVLEYLQTGAADGDRFIAELMRRGAAPTELVTEGYDFKSTFPVPMIERMGEAFIDPVSGNLADTEREALDSIRSFFRDMDREIEIDKRQFNHALDKREVEIATDILGEIDRVIDNVRTDFGERAASAYAEQRIGSVKDMRADLARVTARQEKAPEAEAPVSAAGAATEAPSLGPATTAPGTGGAGGGSGGVAEGGGVAPTAGTMKPGVGAPAAGPLLGEGEGAARGDTAAPKPKRQARKAKPKAKSKSKAAAERAPDAGLRTAGAVGEFVARVAKGEDGATPDKRSADIARRIASEREGDGPVEARAMAVNAKTTSRDQVVLDTGASPFQEGVVAETIEIDADGGRKKAILLTGNLLEAYDYADGKGEFVVITMEDGSTREGLLFPDGWTKPSTEVMMRSVAEVLDAADRMNGVRSGDGVVLIAPIRGARYRIEFSSAKAGDLKGLPGGFKRSGTKMRAEVERQEAEVIVRDILALGVEFPAVDGEGTIADTHAMARPADLPMPNHQPLFSAMQSLPPRAPGDIVTIAGREVPLKPVEAPTRRRGIRNLIATMIGSRLYQGKIRGNSRLGFYRGKNGEVRVANFDDVEVMAHEAAHWMDFHGANDGIWSRFRKGRTVKDKQLAQQLVTEINSVSYTSDAKKVSTEGFAEFIRLYLTQYDVLAGIAPNAIKEFDRLLDQRPKIARQIRKIRDEMHRYFNQGDDARMVSKIGDDAGIIDEIKQWGQTRPFERKRQQLIDNIHAAKVVERTLHGDIGDATESPFKQFQLVNGAEGIHRAVWLYGTPRVKLNGSLEYRGKGLRDVLWPVLRASKTRRAQAMQYFAARRAQELMRQGRENLFTKGEVVAGLALGKKYPVFAFVFDEWLQFNREMLDFYEQMGLITDDQKQAFMEANQNYVPFHRMIEGVEHPEATSDRTVIGKRLHGGQMNVKDIFENIVNSLAENIRQSLIARAKNTLFTDIAKMEDGALFASPLAPGSKKVKAHLEEQTRRIAEVMSRLGLTVSDGAVAYGSNAEVTPIEEIEAALEADPKLMEYWLHGQKPRTSGTYVTRAIVNGKWQWFEVQDQLLVDMLTGMRGLKTNRLIKIVVGARNFQTRTITSMLQFVGANATRDTVTAAILSKNKFVPIKDTLIGMFHFVAKTDLYKEFMLQGAGFGTRIQAMTEATRSRSVIDLPSYNPWNLTMKLFAGYDSFTSAFEYGSRIGDYRLSKKRGVSIIEAAWEARDLTTDFGKRPGSELLATYQRTVPFMNAAVQGIDREIRAIAEIKGKMTPTSLLKLNRAKTRVLMKASVLVAASLLLLAINDDDERWHALTPDQRARYWWIFYDPAKPPLRIPKPHGLGQLFGTIPETAMDYLAGDIKKGGGDAEFARQVLAFSAYYSLSFWDYPGILQPYIEAMMNEKFTGAPIIPYWMTDEAEFQFSGRTPRGYIAFGEATGMSPLLAEHYLKGYTGYLEQYISDATEAILWDEEKWGERPFRRGGLDYLTYQFQGRDVPYRTRWTTGYFDLRRRARAVASVMDRIGRGESAIGPTRAAVYVADESNRLLDEINTQFQKIDRGLGSVPRQVATIKYDPALTLDEKEAQIEALYRARNTRYGEAFRAAEAALADLEERLGQQ